MAYNRFETVQSTTFYRTFCKKFVTTYLNAPPGFATNFSFRIPMLAFSYDGRVAFFFTHVVAVNSNQNTNALDYKS